MQTHTYATPHSPLESSPWRRRAAPSERRREAPLTSLFRQAAKTFRESLKPVTPLKQAVAESRKSSQDWSSYGDFMRYRAAENDNQRRALLQTFEKNMESWIDEWILKKAVISYKHYGKFGIDNSSPYSLSEITGQLIENAKKAEIHNSRYDVDHRCTQTIEDFLANPAVPLGQTLLIFSARGEKSLYHGTYEQNPIHSYITVATYTKTARNATHSLTPDQIAAQPPEVGDEFTQMRLFDPPEIAQQKLAKTQLLGQAYAASNLPKILPQNSREKMTLTHTVLPAGTTLTNPQLQTVLLENSQNWSYRPEWHPQISGAAFWDTMQTAIAATAGIFTKLANSAPTQHSAKIFDAFMADVQDVLLKKVEQLAANYDSPKDEQPLEITTQIFLDLFKAAQTPTQEALEQRERILSQVMLEDEQWIKLQGLKFCPPQFSLEQSAANFNVQLGSLSSFNALPRAAQLDILSNPGSYGLVLVDLRYKGAKQVFLVPLNYFDGQGGIDPSSWTVTAAGEVIGPCGIPLSQDGLVTAVALELLDGEFDSDLAQAVDGLASLGQKHTAFAVSVLRFLSREASAIIGLGELVANVSKLGNGAQKLKHSVATKAQELANPLNYIAYRIQTLLHSGVETDAVVAALFKDPQAVTAVLNPSTQPA